MNHHEPIMICPSCRGEGLLVGPRICNRCKGAGKRARASEAKVIKVCSCGAAHTAESWRELEHVGEMEDGDGGCLELRNCECGSTIAMPLAKVAA